MNHPADDKARLAAVLELHAEHSCDRSGRLLGECVIIFGGDCAMVGGCSECRKPYPCPTVIKAQGGPR